MLKRLSLTTLFVLAACRPHVRGLCATADDCRAGSSCALDGICIASSGHCVPACGAGELCNSSVCIALKPVVRVVLDGSVTLAPAASRVHVHIDAAAAIPLGTLTVTVDSDRLLASGSVADAVAGENFVTLTHFDPEAVGPVSVSASVAYTAQGGRADKARSVAVPALIDAQVPLVLPFVPKTSDTVSGWVPRTATGTLEVRATVDDQAGSGADSATLDLDSCPPASPCTYAGALVSRAANGGSALFSFTVPRTVQTPGSETPVAATVSGRDKVGNVGRAPIRLQIDDAGPTFGAVTLVSQNGVAGEDGKTWFPGGASAPFVEIAVAVSDRGVGVTLTDVVLALNPADISNPVPPSNPRPMLPSPPDGTVHFQVPASAVVGTENHLRFTLSAHDKLLNASVVPPSDANALWIDDDAPTVTNVRVDYAGATPLRSQVCASATSATFICGRDDEKTATANIHLLRDDATTVTFDAFDCGSGLGTSATAKVSGDAVVPASQISAGGIPCPGRPNQTHTYSFPLDAGAHIPGTPDPTTGIAALALITHATDRTGHPEATPGQAPALISLPRWKRQLNGTSIATGAPALLPVAGTSVVPRKILVGTQGATSNLYLLKPDGAQEWVASLSPGVSGDVAVDASGNSYAVSGDSTCPTGGPPAPCGSINMVDLAGKVATSPECSLSAQGLGAAPAITTVAANAPAVIVAATSTNIVTDENVFIFQLVKTGGTGACTLVTKAKPFLTSSVGSLTGVSLSGATVFFSNGAGFSSIPQSGTTFGSTVVTFSSGGGAVSARDPPSILSSAALNPIFGGSDQVVRRTVSTGSGAAPKWMTDTNFIPGNLPGNPVGTPVFDTQAIYTMDDQGTLAAWSLSTGTALGQVQSSPSAGVPASAPVLLQATSVLIVQQDGRVRLATRLSGPPSSLTAVTLLKVGAFKNSITPLSPVVDVRGTGGVAYIPDGSGWLWAIQLDNAPLAATANTWPRPGRDTCNSRNAGLSYCP